MSEIFVDPQPTFPSKTGKLPAEKRLVNVKEFERFIIPVLASMALNENEIFGDGRKMTTFNCSTYQTELMIEGIRRTNRIMILLKSGSEKPFDPYHYGYG